MACSIHGNRNSSLAVPHSSGLNRAGHYDVRSLENSNRCFDFSHARFLELHSQLLHNYANMSVPDIALAGKTTDLDLYSRQFYVYGASAMQRMATSRVLICGMNGLGVEIGVFS